MLYTHNSVESNQQLQSTSTELVQHTQPPQQFLSNSEQTRQLVTDIRKVLEDSDFDQAVQAALIEVGVPERIKQQRDSKLARPQHAANEGIPYSPKSTVTFANTEDVAVADKQDALSAAGGNRQKAILCSNEGAHDVALKTEVHNLLQRTDSMLSRSSGRSSLHRSTSATPHSLNATAISNHSTHMPALLRGSSAGFDFDSASSALETPTLKSTPGSGLRGLESAAPSGHGGSRSMAGAQRRTAAGRLSSIGRRLAFNDSGNDNGRAFGQMLTPEYESAPVGGGAAAFDGLSPSSGDGIGSFSYARRLSHQALSEIGDRFDGHAESQNKGLLYESSVSGDRTTVVLNKSASWKIAAQEAASPYTNFAPLEELVDAVTESVAAASHSTLAGGAVLPSGTSAPGGVHVQDSAAGVLSTSGRKPGALGLVPHKQHTTAHKVALANMLLPEYVESVALARLKAELASVSNSGSAIKGHVNGGGRFDVLLLALTARLSQWSQLERKSEEMFHQMLHSILDEIFAHLLPGETSLQGYGRMTGPKIGDSSTDGAVGSPTAGLGGNSGSSVDYTRPPGSSNQQPLQTPARRVTQEGHPAADDDDAAVQMRPSHSMLKAAFAKLALGQAMLRAGVPMRPNSAGEQPATKSAAAAAGAAASPSNKQSPVVANPTAAVGDDTVAGTPDIGLSPALSRGSSTVTARCNGAMPQQPVLLQQQQNSSSTASPASTSKRPCTAGGARAAISSPFSAMGAEAEPSFAGAVVGPRLTLPRQQEHRPVQYDQSSGQNQQQSKGSWPAAQVQDSQPYSVAAAANSATSAGQFVQHQQPLQQAPPHQQRVQQSPKTWLGELSGQQQEQQQQQQQQQGVQPAAGWLDGWAGTCSSVVTSQPTSPCISPALNRLRYRQQQLLLQQQQQQQPSAQQVPYPYGVCSVTATPCGVTQIMQPEWIRTNQAPCREGTRYQRHMGCSVNSLKSPAAGKAGAMGAAVAAGQTTQSYASSMWSRMSSGFMPTGDRSNSPGQQYQWQQDCLQQQQQVQLQQHDQQQATPRKHSTWQLPGVQAADAREGAAGGLQQYAVHSPNSSVAMAASWVRRSPQATASKTLAAMQQRYEQEQGLKSSIMQQCQQQQLQQHEPGFQSWLAADGSLSTDASPVRQRLRTSGFSPVGSGACSYHTPDQSPCKQPQLQIHPASCCGGSTAVRVCSPGADPGSPLRQQVSIKGGCVNVYTDAVEVQSDTPLEVTVSSGPPLSTADESPVCL